MQGEAGLVQGHHLHGDPPPGGAGRGENEHAVVTSLVSKEEAQAAEIDELVEKTFQGSLPAFVAAFTRREKLSQEDIAALRQMIDTYEEG